MKIYYLVLVILTVGNCTPKNQYIGECELDLFHFDEYRVSFICVKNYVETKFFSNDSELSTTCKNGFYLIKECVVEINFKNCELSQIQNDLFEIYENVYNLDLSDVGLKTLRPEDFVKAKKLKQLSVRGNNLTEVPANLLHDAVNLEDLNFSNNQITCFDSNTFDLGNRLKNFGFFAK